MEHAVLGSLRIGDLLHRKSQTAAVRAAAQQIITRDTVKVRHTHHKVQPAFADAFFVVRQKRLRDTQLLGGLFLRNSFFFAQKRDDAAKFGHSEYSFTMDIRKQGAASQAEKSKTAPVPMFTYGKL